MRRIVAAVALTLITSQGGFANEIKIEGGGTAITTVFLPIKKRFESLRPYTLSIVQSTAVKGLIALQQGKVDIATAAHPLEDLVAGAAKEGVAIDRSKLVATEVEDNQLVVIANRKSEVGRLSREELKGIFTGKITNWKEVGGKELSVRVVWGKETQGQNVQFGRMALDGEPVTAQGVAATTYRDIAAKVGEVEGAIGVVPLEITTPATRSIETITIKSPIYVITRGTPDEKVQAVIDFYRREYSFLAE